ncbi:diguanylate cyclase domain-containing protein [Rhizobium mongolense]|uniref:diguanylate cyclase domain-containing protein n=1 Tax=Rhizobium mongolense TaxID=57676 RepID=UPI003558E189
MHQQVDITRQFFFKVILPLALLTALLLVGSVGGLIWLANYQTKTAIGEQARLARAAVDVHGEALAKGAADYGHWDEAVTAIIDRFDFTWVDGNIGQAGAENYGLAMAFVLDPENRTVYSYVDGKGGEADARSLLSNGFNEIIAHNRAGDHVSPTSGLVTAGNELALVAVAPLRPFEDKVRPQDTGYLVVFVDVLNGGRLAELGHTYLLPNLRFVDIDNESVDPRARIRISDEIRATARYLAWDPVRPGDALLRMAGPVLVIILCAFVALSIFVLRYSGEAARLIRSSEARAMRDALTGLPNRVLLLDRLDRLVGHLKTRQPGVALMYLDLDGFKAVNDEHGHAAGDEILCRVAERLRSLLREQDTAARLGGDEFVVVMPELTNHEELRTRANRIIETLRAPYRLADIVVEIGVSIGIAVSPTDGRESAALLQKADQALYLAKSSGKGTARFHSDKALRVVNG